MSTVAVTDDTFDAEVNPGSVPRQLGLRLCPRGPAGAQILETATIRRSG